jgi:hypothetical protein
MREWLDEQLSLRPEEWQPVSRPVGAAWLTVYALFLLYAARDKEGFLFLDWANLIIHEGGHFLFGWFGYLTGILGGTLLELLVPLGAGLFFWYHKQTTGVAFCAVWFFENFLYIGSYMSDARRLSLPLVGDGTHDWEVLFSAWGVLHRDQDIGGGTRALGWLGMLTSTGWLAWMCFRRRG